MRAGRLRHRLAVYLPTKSNGVSGAETLTLLGTFNAEIKPMTGREYQALQGTVKEGKYKITMRYIRGITEQHIGIWEGKRFKFEHVAVIDERRSEMQIASVVM